MPRLAILVLYMQPVVHQLQIMTTTQSKNLNHQELLGWDGGEAISCVIHVRVEARREMTTRAAMLPVMSKWP